MRIRTASSSPHASPPSAARPRRATAFPLISGTAITSMPCCSGSSCTRRRSSAECATRAATSRTPTSTIPAPSPRWQPGKARPSPLEDTTPSETVSIAMQYGWAWKIPLTSRFGNGYVYSSQFCSADEAETELRRKLGLLGTDVAARHLKMKIGRVTQHWNRNCLAVGLAQGFIEPLEATALLFIQQTAANFVVFLEAGDLSEAAHEKFNAQVNAHFEGTRDYIVTHYKT